MTNTPIQGSQAETIIPSAWTEEPDGSAIGYMCLTDWEFEIGNASGGNRIFPSEADIRHHRKCVESCGIVEVRVSCIRVVDPGKDWDEQFAAQGTETGTAETARGLGPKGDGPVGGNADAPGA